MHELKVLAVPPNQEYIAVGTAAGVIELFYNLFEENIKGRVALQTNFKKKEKGYSGPRIDFFNKATNLPVSSPNKTAQQVFIHSFIHSTLFSNIHPLYLSLIYSLSIYLDGCPLTEATLACQHGSHR